jgi:perosamine synthetase
MAKKFIMQMRPSFGAEEKKAIIEYMDEDGFLTEFNRTKEFEERIAEFAGSKHCVVVNNGTISLTLAAIAIGLIANDEVIVPNYTMIATANSIKMIGVKPVFVDVEPDTLCLDINEVRKAITSKTKAIFFVSANGRYPKAGILEFEKLAEEFGIPLVEDAAQSLGSFYPDGRHIGRAGLIGSFSFSAPKIISTGQGGALITDNDQIASKLRKLKDFGRTSGGIDIHESIGFNFKFTELQACVGNEQMKKLGARVIRKKKIWKKYHELLTGIEEVSMFNHNLDFTSPWFIDARIKNRDLLSKYLNDHGVGTRKMYPPIHSQIPYKDIKGDFPVSTEIGLNGLWLPSHIDLSDEDIQYICEKIKNFYI